ncbi:MAG: hypothetical protein ACRDQ5_15710, partial [Sciscionella sp.]
HTVVPATPARPATPPRGARGGARRAVWAATLLVLVFSLLALAALPAAADPPVGTDPATVPANLQQYMPDSPQWTTSPWMTSPACRDHGGDWSSYVEHVIADTSALLRYFQPDLGGSNAQRTQALLAGYASIPGQVHVPGGYCVDEVASWATPDSSVKPFGFRWGNDEEHQTRYACTDGAAGAARAPCDGFYISCGNAASAAAHNRCEAWNTFSDSYVTAVTTMRRKVLDQYPGEATAPIHTHIKSPAEILQNIVDWTVKTGMAQVVAFIVSGVTKLWALFMKIIVDVTSPTVSGSSFAGVYNLIAGIALALAFLGWLLTLATSWREGRLQYSLLGGVKAAVGVTLAGVGAILMVQLADECTKSLLDAGSHLTDKADFTNSLAKTNPLVAIIVGGLLATFLIFAIIFLVLDSAVVLMWALFGSVAAAGQVHPASSGWLPRWVGRLTALAWAKFFMVGVMLLCQALLIPVRGTDSAVKQIIDVVEGLTLGLLLVLVPFLLWELVDFVSDRAGGAAAVGGAGSQMATRGAGRA